MKSNEKKFRALLQEVRLMAAQLGPSKARRISNYCDKISVTYKRGIVAEPCYSEGETAAQVEKRYIARKAILAALMAGRRISLLDSAEFQVSQMHTQIHLISKDLEAMPEYTLKSRWITCGTSGARCKEYWLEKDKPTTLFSVLERHTDGAWWYHPSYSFTTAKAARIAAQRFTDDVFQPRQALIICHAPEFPKKSVCSSNPYGGDFRAVDGETCHVDVYRSVLVEPETL